MKGSPSARMEVEDGPRTHCPHSALSEGEKKKKKALYWKGNDPNGPAVM